MRNVLHRIHEWFTRNPVSRFEDPVLGELVINESSWQRSVETNAGPIVLTIGGRYEPDQELLETARKTVQDIDGLIARVNDYLAGESEEEKWHTFADEITSLTIADINYWWPGKPNAGMIFFRGPDECRLWHCDINGSRFHGLAFDS